MGDKSIKTMKKQTKNLKQFRKFKTRAKFQFYVVFRPVAQKVFFVPALVYIVFLGVNDWYDKKWDGWTFINETNAETVDILSSSAPFTGAPVSEPNGVPVSVMVETKAKGGVGSPVAPQAEVIERIKKAFPHSPEVAVAIAKAESSLDPSKPSSTDVTKDGHAFSWGLFQLNLTVTNINGVACNEAFEGRNYKAVVKDKKLFEKCVKLATDPDLNIQVAVKKFEGRGNYTAWGAYTNGSYLKHL